MESKLNNLNVEIGQRMREAREKLPRPSRNLTDFSKQIDVSQAYLSQMESGKRPIPVHVLVRIAEATGVRFDHLVSGQSFFSEDSSGFTSSIHFLQKASDLGILGMETTRDRALHQFLPYLKSMRSCEVDITASTLRGLMVDPNNLFVAELKTRLKGDVKIRILFTHLEYACLREQLENRAVGGIVDEVVQGIQWAYRTWNVPISNMKFVRSAPNTFSIFVSDTKRAFALLNPYPLMEQAYTSFTFLVQSSFGVTTDRLMPNAAMYIYDGLHNSNFLGPWDAPNIAVGLEEGAKEIQNLRAERQRQQKQQKTEAIKSSTLLGEEQRKAVEKAADSLLAFLNGITANKPPAALT